MRRNRAVVEALGQVSKQVADPHAGRARLARADCPHECGLVWRVAHGEDIHIERRAGRRTDDAEHDRARINLRIRPREIYLVIALYKRYDPLFFDKRGARVIELDFYTLAHR